MRHRKNKISSSISSGAGSMRSLRPGNRTGPGGARRRPGVTPGPVRPDPGQLPVRQWNRQLSVKVRWRAASAGALRRGASGGGRRNPGRIRARHQSRPQGPPEPGPARIPRARGSISAQGRGRARWARWAGGDTARVHRAVVAQAHIRCVCVCARARARACVCVCV